MTDNKVIRWPRGFEKEVLSNTLQTVFHLGTDNKDSIELLEPVEILVGNPGEALKYMGVAEVVSIKTCCIRDLESDDLLRQKPGFQTKREVINTFRKIYPDYGDITLSTAITVITLRRCDYSLKRLNTMVSRNVVKKT